MLGLLLGVLFTGLFMGVLTGLPEGGLLGGLLFKLMLMAGRACNLGVAFSFISLSFTETKNNDCKF